MTTLEDRKKQAHVEFDTALAKRKIAWQKWKDAGEELKQARIKLQDILNEEYLEQKKKGKR